MKNITLVTIGLGLLIVVLMLFGCACADNFIEESIKEAPQEKPTAAFNIPDETWVGLMKEISLNGIKMNANSGVVNHWGISIKYDYIPTSEPPQAEGVLILHKIKVGFPASFESLGGWNEERVLNLVKEKLVKQGAKL